MELYSQDGESLPTYNWVFEYKLIAWEIQTQPNSYKRAESNLLTDEKGPHHLGQVVVWVIKLYFYIYWFVKYLYGAFTQ